MTALEARLQEDQKEAMKTGDKTLLGLIRLLRSQLQYARMQAGEGWSEEKAQEVLSAAAKTRRESISLFEKGGRMDLVEKEKAELALLERYLPAQLSDQELATLIELCISEVGARDLKDIGKVMAALMQRVKGRADGKALNERVRARLSGTQAI
ncbi:MAG TPA: GatB/YqeY domain-containing protein [Candidatus Latescibacteria bacterium]|nr:GatB/YqeY domain-containing protein [Candidatus Latescibacterota bacterium]